MLVQEYCIIPLREVHKFMIPLQKYREIKEIKIKVLQIFQKLKFSYVHIM